MCTSNSKPDQGLSQSINVFQDFYKNIVDKAQGLKISLAEFYRNSQFLVFYHSCPFLRYFEMLVIFMEQLYVYAYTTHTAEYVFDE